MVGIWGIFRNFVDDMKQGLLFCATWIAGAGVLVRLSSTMMGSPWLTVISDSLMILGGFVAALMGVFPLMAAGHDGLQPAAAAGMRSDRGRLGLWRVGPYRVDVPLAVYLCVCALSVAVCRPDRSFMAVPKLALFVLMLAAIGPLVVSAGLCEMRQRLWRLLLWGLRVIVLLSFIVYVTAAIVDVHSRLYDFIPYADRAGITNERIMLSAISALVAVDALWKATLAGGTGRRRRMWLIALAAAAFLTLMQAASRMALIGCVAAMLYVAVAHRRYILAHRKALFIAVAGATFILILGATFFSQAILQKLSWDFEAGSLFRSRSELWSDRWGEFLDNPVLGLGFHAFDRCTLPTADPNWTPADTPTPRLHHRHGHHAAYHRHIGGVAHLYRWPRIPLLLAQRRGSGRKSMILPRQFSHSPDRQPNTAPFRYNRRLAPSQGEPPNQLLSNQPYISLSFNFVGYKSIFK